MNIIGFNLGFNASACLLIDGKVKAAISQERLNGNKNTKEFPINAIIECCRVAGVKEVDEIVYSHYQTLTFDEVKNTLPAKYKGYENENLEDLFCKILEENGIKSKVKNVIRFEHHKAHLNAAFPIYGKAEEFVGITADGFGDGVSLRIVHNICGMEEVLVQKELVDSIALVYQFFTGALGYKMHQHEGKITGLAAYGHTSHESELRSRFCKDGAKFWEVDVNKLDELDEQEKEKVKNSTIIDFENFLRLKKSIFRYVYEMRELSVSAEDLAKTVQEFSEHEIIAIIKQATKGIENKPICYLSGGLFANVKINQRIKETKLFKEVAVVPPMGDEGTAIGAAYLRYEALTNKMIPETKNNFNNVIAGTYMNNLIEDEIVQLLSEGYSIKCCDEKELQSIIVDALSKKKIVCLCRGRMEYGPRALCHRSILYDCSEQETNGWLNKQLGRTEFMPFAPVCLDKNASDLFIGIDTSVDRNTKFMTMTFDCTEEFKNDYKAACHIDGTARPQILFKDDCDSFAYGLLEIYEQKTGKKALINTSFNLHNYPIIESVEVAIESWKQSNTDMLVINNFVIAKG
jgi:carbamoyltransferase